MPESIQTEEKKKSTQGKMDIFDVALEGFNNQEKNKIANALKEELGLNTVNIPTKISAGRLKILIVSKTGEALTNPSLSIIAVVNPQWVEDSI